MNCELIISEEDRHRLAVACIFAVKWLKHVSSSDNPNIAEYKRLQRFLEPQ